MRSPSDSFSFSRPQPSVQLPCRIAVPSFWSNSFFPQIPVPPPSSFCLFPMNSNHHCLNEFAPSPFFALLASFAYPLCLHFVPLPFLRRLPVVCIGAAQNDPLPGKELRECVAFLYFFFHEGFGQPFVVQSPTCSLLSFCLLKAKCSFPLPLRIDWSRSFSATALGPFPWPQVRHYFPWFLLTREIFPSN